MIHPPGQKSKMVMRNVDKKFVSWAELHGPRKACGDFKPKLELDWKVSKNS